MIIDDLPSISIANDSDEIAIEQGTATKKITKGNFLQEVTSAISSLLSSLNGKVSKAGDTMTGALTIDRTNNVGPSIVLYDGNDIDITPSSAVNSNNLYWRDKNEKWYGLIRSRQLTDGRYGMWFAAARKDGGAANGIALYYDQTGNTSVIVDAPDAWRTALGLGSSSGAFPITIAQGGSGQTGTISETTAANIATAATGFSISSARFYQWGKVVQLHLTVKRTGTSISSAQTITFATINSGKRPVSDCGVWNEATTLLTSYIRAGGTVGAYGTWTQNTTIAFYATYLLP